MVKAVQGAPVQVDISANFLFNDKFTLGAAYRLEAAASAMLGFQISDQTMIGLAYDREITELGGTAFNSGSFEIMLRYDFITKLRGVKPSRFF